MSQYSTGLASTTNNSPTVTGTNTLWLANVSAGDSFTVAGDGVMYDVASVDSDTQVTLSVAYAGVTASGAVYAIGTGFTVPDSFPEMSQGDIETATIFTRALRKIQSKFTALVSDIGGKAAIAGQVFTGPVGVESGVDFSGTTDFRSSGNLLSVAANNTNAGNVASVKLAARDDAFLFQNISAANNDISLRIARQDSGSAAITPLITIDNSDNVGIGTTTPASALDVVGGISSTAMPQVGGDPIVESGSNADGEWTRWADGTQVEFTTIREDLPTAINTIGDVSNFDMSRSAPLSYSWNGAAAELHGRAFGGGGNRSDLAIVGRFYENVKVFRPIGLITSYTGTTTAACQHIVLSLMRFSRWN